MERLGMRRAGKAWISWCVQAGEGKASAGDGRDFEVRLARARCGAIRLGRDFMVGSGMARDGMAW